MHTHWDVIVVGGGAAGLSAALMLGRARRRVLVIDAGVPRNRFAAHMHGVLGNEGLDPAELLRRGRDEVAQYGVEMCEGTVERVDPTDGGVAVHLTAKETIGARALIVATGVTDRLPEIPGLAERWGTSVLHCPYCHGWEVRDQRLAVLTTSPLGMHQAQLVRQWSDRLVVFTAGLGTPGDGDTDRLRARGIRLVDDPVTEVLGEGEQVTGVRTASGDVIEVDAIFTAGTLVPHDSFLTHLDLARAENPMGSFLAVDETGRTSHERIWAVGNVTNPGANVPMVVSAGALAGAMANMALVTEDFDRATGGWPVVAPEAFWEEFYAGSDQVWSGRVNATLARVAATMQPGTALDLGCGEGADVVWLAQRGWRATGIDISPTAIARARSAAGSMGVGDECTFVASDLSALDGSARYDLVSASFLHSPVELPREAVLRQAAALVAPGGHLLITSHAAAPPWADASAHDHRFLSPTEELEQLALDPQAWETVLADTHLRPATSPDGQEAELEDSVILLRRRE